MSSRKPSTLSTRSAFFPTASSPLDDSHGLSSATVSWREKKKRLVFFFLYPRAKGTMESFQSLLFFGKEFWEQARLRGFVCIFSVGGGGGEAHLLDIVFIK